MKHNTYTYKGFTIIRTEITTIVKVQRPYAEAGRTYPKPARLFEIEGLKSAETRPFITSYIDAKNFINESLETSVIENLSDEEVHSEISY